MVRARGGSGRRNAPGLCKRKRRPATMGRPVQKQADFFLLVVFLEPGEAGGAGAGLTVKEESGLCSRSAFWTGKDK